MATRNLLVGLLLAICFPGISKVANTQVADDITAARNFRSVEVAAAAYQKLKRAAESNKGAISDGLLHGASRAWLEAKLRAARSKPECIEAATEYLEREGYSVAKNSTS
jgi:hypothetical protein